MFDIGFSEMVVIAVVALVVLGPERLPKVARAAGILLGRVQRYVNDVKSDISREMQLEELKKLQAQVEDSARSIERSVTTELQTAQASLNETAQSVSEPVAAVASEVATLPETVGATVHSAAAEPVEPIAPVAAPKA